MINTAKEKYNIQDLLDVMDALLGENGCPWDKEQTHVSIKRELIEECYEAVDAVQSGDIPGMCEEFGDLLLHVVFHSKIAQKNGEFTFDDVAHGITEKLIRRHSHVFGDKTAGSAAEVIDNWEAEKQKEKGYTTAADKLNRIPKAYPALLRAQKFINIAAKAGLYEQNPPAAELASAVSGIINKPDISEADIGSALLLIAEFAEKNNINAEIALSNAIDKSLRDTTEKAGGDNR